MYFFENSKKIKRIILQNQFKKKICTFLKIPKNQFLKKVKNMYFLKNSKKIKKIILQNGKKKVSQGKTLKYHLKCGKSAAG